jgi:hypothetical protein
MTRLVVALAAALLVSAASWADVIYTYSGHPFDEIYGTACPPVCGISGYFTLAAPLPANQGLTQIAPLYFSFTDGSLTIDSTNSVDDGPFGPTHLWVGTDALGTITQWTSGYFSATHFIISGTNPPGCSGCMVRDASGENDFNPLALVDDSPGTWSLSTAPVPEPSTLLLFGGGLLAAVRRLRSRAD